MLAAHARKLLGEQIPVVLAGDYNVAPTEIDIYPTTSWDDDALVQPAIRAARLVKQGWTDAIRELHPDQRVYTFWHYMRNRYARDAGLRLDQKRGRSNRAWQGRRERSRARLACRRLT
jgi:exodeoxyribonuclease-3